MRFRVNVWYNCKEDNLLACIYLPKKSGAYWVNFNSREVKYYSYNDVRHMLQTTIGDEKEGPDISIRFKFSESEMTKKTATPEIIGKVMSIVLGNITWFKGGKELNLLVEYLDTTYGKIQKHYHPGKVREVYLSTHSPYGGEVCGYGEAHEPFSNHTIAIKFIVKEIVKE